MSMTKFKIIKDQLDKMQIKARVLCQNFDIDNPVLNEQDIIHIKWFIFGNEYHDHNKKGNKLCLNI